jgi:periplasmic protein TonB
VSTLDLPAERLRDPRQTTRGRNWPGRAAIAAAVLLHAAIIAGPLLWWHVTPSEVPAAMPVTLVFEPPPPPPVAVPEPPPPPPPREFAKRESGADEKTTAPPQAEEPAPIAAPEPPPGPMAPAQPTPAPVPPAGGGKAKPAPALAHLPEPHREAPVPRAPQPKPSLADRAVGTKEETGDPYLNHLWELIERNRLPTTPLGPEGLHLAGTTTFTVVIERGGTVSMIRVMQSSGSPVLDQQAERMIASAAPFPPLPADYPAPAPLKVTISLYPQ